MATNNSVNVPLAGNIGTVKFAGTTSPTFITPTLGAATATTVAFSPTTGGIIGTTAADNTSAGNVGEFLSTIVSYASRTSVTSQNVAQALTNITLSAGDWDVWGNITYIPDSGTIITACYCGLASSVALPDPSQLSGLLITSPANFTTYVNAVPLRFNVNTSTVVYVVGQAAWTVSTLKFCGGIYARRVR